MDLTDWLTNLTVTDFEEKALPVLLGAGATWLGTKVNSTSPQKRERLARKTERRHIFERDALVDVQDALYRVVEDLVLSWFPPGGSPQVHRSAGGAARVPAGGGLGQDPPGAGARHRHPGR